MFWFLSVRHVVDSFTSQNVLAPKGPSSVAKKGTKQIMQDEKHSRRNSGGANFQAPNSFVKNGPVSQILCGI